MDIMTALFIYLLIWWLTLFTVLPLGVKRHEEQGKGFDAGAPAQANLAKKLVLNSIIAAIILAIIQGLIMMGVINWHAWFEETGWK
jgi:predicted secreted protein